MISDRMLKVFYFMMVLWCCVGVVVISVLSVKMLMSVSLKMKLLCVLV